MVIAGTINRVAFYCRVNHRDRDYEKYLEQNGFEIIEAKMTDVIRKTEMGFADIL